ncbi:hypothetical protein GJ744_003581 [Endocarpon pusillum]|uniref:Uncharacterized protein n=1 Tax=Endocarpon pusillum TaxID=364733 RepID=A0A8H7A6T4_9EURO|nr:hypothetical protein GJ744_003581 [Endocarpon pusillum]
MSLCYDGQSSILCSADSSSRIMVHKLIRKRTEWIAATKLLDHRTGIAVEQLLTNEGCTRLLISSAATDILWSIEAGESKPLSTVAWNNRRRYRWSIHPAEKSQLLLVTDNVAHLYDWQSLTRLTPEQGIHMLGSVLPELAVRSIVPCFDG